MVDHSRVTGSGKAREVFNALRTSKSDEMELIDPKGAEA